MTGGASITASSKGPANAGNISINAGQQFKMRDSSITSNGDEGQRREYRYSSRGIASVS